jgi:hypothetical protein
MKITMRLTELLGELNELVYVKLLKTGMEDKE